MSSLILFEIRLCKNDPSRSGLASMMSSALVGGVILALIEGVGIAVARFSSGVYRPVSPVERQVIYRKQQAQKGFGDHPTVGLTLESSSIS